MRFPYPVLWSRTNDYEKGQFGVKLEIEESLNSGALTLRYEVVLEEEQLAGFGVSGKISCGLFITCADTYFNELKQISLAKGEISIPGGRLRGRVHVRPLLWASMELEDYQSSNFHREFDREGWKFAKGNILAIGDEYEVNVGREKLYPMESIFSLSFDQLVPPEEIRLQLNTEKITILASKAAFDKIHLLRGTTRGKSVLLNSIYLPAVLDVLSYLKNDDQAFEGRRWHTAFMARIDFLGLDIKNGDELENGQKLLGSPFRRLLAKEIEKLL
jgi:hypothetical protein